MRSSDLKEFGPWHRWPKNALRNAPNTPGVYVFRIVDGRCFGRLKGESDIAYIGATVRGAGTLRKRLLHHQSAFADKSYQLARIQSHFVSLEVAWKECLDHQRALIEECTLLSHYQDEHIELPPANRQQSFKNFHLVYDYYVKASPEERAAFFERVGRQRNSKTE